MAIQKEEEKSFFRKHWPKLLIVLLLLLLLIGGGVTAAIVLTNQTPKTVVSVTFDPMKIDADNAEWHLNSADQFDIILSEGKEEHTQNVDENLLQGESLKFCYKITNNGPENVSWSLNLANLLNSGFKIQVQLGEFENPTDFNEGETFSRSVLESGQTDNLYVYISVANPLVTSSISGVVVLTISVG